MTVAVVLKVFDGLILAADSATTYELTNGSHQVYNNANKVFHLHRNLPVAAMTWGLANIGSASIETLAKDLRLRLMGLDPDHKSWELKDGYTLNEVADRVVEMFYDELFLTEYPDPASPPPSALGLLVGGYSSGVKQTEAYTIVLESAASKPVPTHIIDVPTYGWQAFAQPQATARLFNGIDPDLSAELQGALDTTVWANEVAPRLSAAARQPAIDSMPFADAISLAEFLVRVTAEYSHFLLGPDTVGGTIEVAGINRHEGFRWIKRKHYYPIELNPTGHGHA